MTFSERATIANSAVVHDQMCRYMSFIFEGQDSPYRPSEIVANYNRSLATKFSPRDNTINRVIEQYVNYWSIAIDDLQCAYEYACSYHWSIEDILKEHYLYYTSLRELATLLDLLPKSIAHYCQIGTKRFLSSYAQLSHDRALLPDCDNHSVDLLLAIDPYIASLTL